MELVLLLGVFVWIFYQAHHGGPAPAGAPNQSPKAPANKPAEYTDERGYQRYAHNHKLVHRAVMERKLGRKLRPEEVVHHKDRNKQNNDPRNLWVFKNQAEHDAQHRRDAEKYGEWWSYNGNAR